MSDERQEDEMSIEDMAAELEHEIKRISAAVERLDATNLSESVVLMLIQHSMDPGHKVSRETIRRVLGAIRDLPGRCLKVRDAPSLEDVVQEADELLADLKTEIKAPGVPTALQDLWGKTVAFEDEYGPVTGKVVEQQGRVLVVECGTDVWDLDVKDVTVLQDGTVVEPKAPTEHHWEPPPPLWTDRRDPGAGDEVSAYPLERKANNKSPRLTRRVVAVKGKEVTWQYVGPVPPSQHGSTVGKCSLATWRAWSRRGEVTKAVRDSDSA